MNEKKYVVEITPQGCAWVFQEHGEPSQNAHLLVRCPEQVALVVFTGGHDVWPELYGENVRPGTYFDAARDYYESSVFEHALRYKVPMVGICRGSQFLCVKSGGKLAQDIRGHGRFHTIRTNDDRIIRCNSSHHQMQLPPKNAIPLAWAEPRLSAGYYRDGDDEHIDVDREYEVVYYPNIHSLSCQFHPEWLDKDSEAVKYIQEVVNTYLFKKGDKDGARAFPVPTASITSDEMPGASPTSIGERRRLGRTKEV